MTQAQLFAEEDRQEFTGHLVRADAPAYGPPTEFPSFRDAKRICLDFETHDPDLFAKGPGVRRDGYIVGTALNIDDQYKNYWPMRHVYGPNCDPDKVTSWLRDELRDFKGEIVGANSNLYDGDYAQHAGIRAPKAKWRDVQWAEALIDESSESYSLEALGEKYLSEGKSDAPLKTLYGEDCKLHFREIHSGHAAPYAVQDVSLPFRILDKQKEALRKEGLVKLFDLECRLNPFLLYMREKGVRVNLHKAEQMEQDFTIQRNSLIHELSMDAGFPVNIYSNEQIGAAFDKFGVQYPLTDKGAPSFRAQWLKRQTHPFAAKLQEAREIEKLRGTFIESYILDGHINGRIHCQFHPLRSASEEEGERGTVTGRFSSTDPNLQNIPTRTELAKHIRELFIPESGWIWWARDYSQIEYRMLVHYAVLAACQGAEVAQRMYIEHPDTDFHVMVSELTGLARKDAKNLNFGLAYGMGIWKLALTLGLVNADGSPAPKAIEVMDTYHDRAPFIKAIYNLASDRAQRVGFVKTILNRRSRFNTYEPRRSERGQHFDDLPYGQALAAYGEVRRAKTHKALNRVLQGSAADLMKMAMVLIWEAGLIHENGPLAVHLTVHDELDGSADPGAEGQKYLSELQHIMETAIPLKVPVLTSGSTGPNWAAAK